jgi:hypothetical protein
MRWENIPQMHFALIAEIEQEQQSDLELLRLKEQCRRNLELILANSDQRTLISMTLVLNWASVNCQALLSNAVAEADA